MNNNDVIRRIRYAFDLSDGLVIDIFASAGKEVSRAQISNWLKQDDDPEFAPLYDVDLAYFLNGFINLKRGKKEGVEMKPEKKLTNNIVFRKLKIALSLKDDDILQILKSVGMDFSKHELSALFRKPSQEKYRACKDQVLRKFLQGVQLKYRKG